MGPLPHAPRTMIASEKAAMAAEGSETHRQPRSLRRPFCPLRPSRPFRAAPRRPPHNFFTTVLQGVDIGQRATAYIANMKFIASPGRTRLKPGLAQKRTAEFYPTSIARNFRRLRAVPALALALALAPNLALDPGITFSSGLPRCTAPRFPTAINVLLSRPSGISVARFRSS